MKVELELPDWPFDVGDFVRSRRFGADIVAQVRYLHASGGWTVDTTDNHVHVDKRVIGVVLQGGRASTGAPLRPGLRFEFDPDECESASWDGEVVSVDTLENIDARCDAWENGSWD